MRSLLFSLVILCFAACEQVVEVTLPPHQPKLVVNGFVHPGDSFRVEVSRSVSVLETAQRPAYLEREATVRVWEDGQALPLLVLRDTCRAANGVYGLGCYSLPLRPRAGATYRVEVSHPTLGEVVSETAVPPAPVIRDPSYRFDVGENIFGAPLSLIEFTLEDPPGPNGYEIYAVLTYEIRGRLQTRIQPYGGNVPDNFIDDNATGIGLLSDELFDGEVTRVSLYFWAGSGTVSNGQEVPIEIKDLVLIVRSCSPAYFAYRETIDAHLLNQVAPSDLFPTSPIPAYSNVSGGYGIWAGYHAVRDTLL